MISYLLPHSWQRQGNFCLLAEKYSNRFEDLDAARDFDNICTKRTALV
jgi:hypothetical protein